MIKSIITIASITLLAIAPASKVDLKFALEKDKVYGQRSSMVSNTKQSMMGQEMSFESKASSVTYFQLKDSNAEGGDYELWYGDIELSFSGMGGEQAFGSKDTSTAVGAILAQLVNQKWQAGIQHNGSIAEISGLEDIIASITASDQDEESQIAQQISSSFGDEGLARNLEMGLNIFADKAVKKGESWVKTHRSNSGMPLLIENTYLLKEVSNDIATIEVSGVINVDPENNTAELQGMDATYFLEGTRAGTMTVEIKTGWVMAASIKDDIAGSISIEANAMIPEGMTLPMEINNVITIDGSVK